MKSPESNTLNRPEVGTGFSSLQVDHALVWVLGIRNLSLTILLFRLRMGKRIHHLSG